MDLRQRAFQLGSATGASSQRSVVRRVLRGLGLIGVVVMTAAGCMYLLALQGLRDLETETGSRLHSSGSGAMAVEAMHHGMIKASMGEGRAMELGGHAAPVMSADIAGGTHIVSTDAAGGVRLTNMDAAHKLHTSGLTDFSNRLYDAIWKPYGAVAARWSLDHVAQVMPLHIPDRHKGRRGRIFKDCDVCPEMVEVEPGMFFKGAPETDFNGKRNLTAMSARIAVSKLEVSQVDWNTCVKDGVCKTEKSAAGLAVATWQEANSYIAWLNNKAFGSGSEQRKKYRLMSDVEWDYVVLSSRTSPVMHSFGRSAAVEWATMCPPGSSDQSAATCSYFFHGEDRQGPGISGWPNSIETAQIGFRVARTLSP